MEVAMNAFTTQQCEAEERFKKWEDERWQRNVELEGERRTADKAHDVQLFQMLGEMLAGHSHQGSQSYFNY